MICSYPLTEQNTPAGRTIEHASFAIIDAEAAPHAYEPDQWAIVRRMIHAGADFEMNGLTVFHPRAVSAGLGALRQSGAPLVADVGMILAGLAPTRLQRFGVRPHQFIADADVIDAAQIQGTTRAVQAMRKAQRLGLLDGAIIGIGNAPTALIELLRLIEEEGARPALVIGMPVGFVAAAESKALLAAVSLVPWITVQGRKGGSTLVVAAIHSLLALAEADGGAASGPHPAASPP
ncbi:precorrin-8X methylmutase [uncultured Lamprocystis sp.]|jgi:precorrin-8X/cobalt-precorrin-8 methylmutase|uniref:precorrin-8X methylmutase n=1 Tax=uncultured Lamprocystis sp. TaxID=543132 RepID=UPI0025EC992A|nr:precorrin-8X methylmutase [uncultured Lamprocystis sp.]